MQEIISSQPKEFDLARYFAALYRPFEAPLLSKYWRLKLLLACIIVAGVMQVPRYQYFYKFAILNDGSNAVYTAFQQQLAEPFKPRIYELGSHESKMAFRLTMPLIVKYTGMPAAGFLLVQLVFGILMHYAIIKLIYDLTKDRLTTAFLVLGLSCTYFGCAFLYDIMALFDSLSYAILIFMFLFRNPFAIASLMLIGAFNDERTIIAAPIVILWHVCLNNKSIAEYRWSALIKSFFYNRQTQGILGSVFVYGVLRLLLASRFSLPTDDGYVGGSALAVNALAGALEVGLVSALESYWVILIVAIL